MLNILSSQDNDNKNIDSSSSNNNNKPLIVRISMNSTQCEFLSVTSFHDHDLCSLLYSDNLNWAIAICSHFIECHWPKQMSRSNSLIETHKFVLLNCDKSDKCLIHSGLNLENLFKLTYLSFPPKVSSFFHWWILISVLVRLLPKTFYSIKRSQWDMRPTLEAHYSAHIFA